MIDTAAPASSRACPSCGRPVDGSPASPCPGCGLPAAVQAAAVVGRIGATMADLAADREALLATLRALAPGRIPGPPPAAPARLTPQPSPQPLRAVLGSDPPPTADPLRALLAALGGSRRAPVADLAAPVRAALSVPASLVERRPRPTPQQVLVGLGALLVVTAATAFVAVAWTRLGVVFQAGAMALATAAACGASVATARRGLRATEEALAAAGAALLVIGLTAARALGLAGLDAVPARPWAATTCAAVLAAGLLLGRAARTTTTWPVVALVAAQLLPFLVLPAELAAGSAGVAAALALAAADVLVLRRLRAGLHPLGLALARLSAVVGVAGGLLVAVSPDAARSWAATAVLAAAGAAAVVLTRLPVPTRLPSAVTTARAAAAVTGLAGAFSLGTPGSPGPLAAAALGLVLLTAAAPLSRRRLAEAALVAGGAPLVAVGVLELAAGPRYPELAAVALAAVVPAALAAVLRPSLRRRATAAAQLAAAGSVLLASAGALVTAEQAGLSLAVLAASGYALAAARTGRTEETAAALVAGLTGLAAGATTATAGAWGQAAVQLGVAGSAMACYALAARRPRVLAVAVAELVAASWVAVAGAGVTAPEAYTLPAAVGLLLVALPRLRAGASSWAAEGAAIGVALVPSALAAVEQPGALRLLLVVTAATALTVAGTLTHRQAPFVLGAAVLALVASDSLGPYTALLPRWLTLGAAGLLLLVVGASYERRRQQAREAVAWVAQMR